MVNTVMDAWVMYSVTRIQESCRDKKILLLYQGLLYPGYTVFIEPNGYFIFKEEKKKEQMKKKEILINVDVYFDFF